MTAELGDINRVLPALITAARNGDIVEIIDDGWTYRLTAIAPRPHPAATGIPRAGRWKGKFTVPPDFKEPLDELREYME